MEIKNWKMDFMAHSGLECTVPCDMYSVLLDHKIIEEPYYGTNEERLSQLSHNDCVFYTTVDLTEDELLREHIELRFYGLDTICDIYFNGTLLDSVFNMHRMYEYDIRGLAREKNEIRLFFKSPLEYFEKMEKSHHLYTNGDTVPGAAHLRKALYMSGWDWAPTLPNMGIFRKVTVECYDDDRLGDIEITQYHENGKVRLLLECKTRHSVSDLQTFCVVEGQRVELINGQGEYTFESPRLWYPNGYGEQNLYDLEFCLYKGNECIDRVTKTVGLRTLGFSREDDEYGQEFCFKVNGIKIFAMGANMVPMDSLTSRLSKERTEELIQDCIFANFNCIRIWGGAFYPEDYFYDLCDRYGLIVWQDFMVACANVWLRPEFEREIMAEAEYNVKRIRHHACLGVLCGNNEMEEALCFWEDTDGDDPQVRADYLRLYEDLFPTMCAKIAPQISYTSSSPTSGGNFNNPKDYTRGDVHFWDVWNGGCELYEYRRHKFRFCSEYGFESLPSIKTVYDFCPQDELNPLSYTMEMHQKHWHGNVKLIRYLAEEYPLPKNLEMTVYASQLNQANAMRYGVEHFRRCRGYTMGSIYWQLNDCWPVASWSSIDYYGRYKALHYFARRFYQPIALGLFNEGESITVNIANESLSTFDGYIVAGVRKNDFTLLWEKRVPVAVNALFSLDAAAFSNTDFDGMRDAYFYAELYNNQGELVSRNVELGKKPKHFKLLDPKIHIEAEKTDEGVCFTLSACALAKSVEISFMHHDLVLSDNYFDLPTDKPYKIFAKTDICADELLKDICIISVYDIPAK